MNIVFLDIDGVLNSHKWFATKPEDCFLGHLDPGGCALIQRLCEETSSRLVISSTWRKLHDLGAIGIALSSKGLKAEIIGATPDLSTRRGFEIQEWLNLCAKSFEPTGMVILDDDSDMEHLMPWLVKTTFDFGVQEHHIERAKRVLKNHIPRSYG